MAGDADSAEDAFARFATSRLDESYRVARLILRDEHEAQDATHDAFIAAWRARRALRDPDRVDAWFGRILVNSCRQRLRARGRRPTSVLSDEPVSPDPDPYSETDDRDSLSRAFVGLNADQRIAIVLRYYRGLAVDEIARLVGAPAGTIKSRLHHGLNQMREAMEPPASAMEPPASEVNR